jgi:hypothetical protein
VRLRWTATSGANLRMPSSWNDESSTTHVFGADPLPFAPVFVAKEIQGVP